MLRLSSKLSNEILADHLNSSVEFLIRKEMCSDDDDDDDDDDDNDDDDDSDDDDDDNDDGGVCKG